MTKPRQKCMARVQKYVRDHFPDMKGVKPSVSSRKGADQIRYRFTFRKTLQASDGQKLRQILHLTADEEGNVVKASVSR